MPIVIKISQGATLDPCPFKRLTDGEILVGSKDCRNCDYNLHIDYENDLVHCKAINDERPVAETYKLDNFLISLQNGKLQVYDRRAGILLILPKSDNHIEITSIHESKYKEL